MQFSLGFDEKFGDFMMMFVEIQLKIIFLNESLLWHGLRIQHIFYFENIMRISPFIEDEIDISMKNENGVEHHMNMSL